MIPIDQSPSGSAAKLIFGYITRDQNRITTNWGTEIHGKFLVTNELIASANYTWFNLPEGMPGDLNFPQNKIRFGLQYQPVSKFSGAVNYQWDQAYTSNNANYPGKIDAKSLLDLNLGYQINTAIKFEINATNLLNNEFRALPGFPKIGRTLTGRLVFDF